MNPKASLVIGILCISFSPIFVKLTDASPITSGFYRIFIAWLCLLPYCVANKSLRIARRDLIVALIGGIIFASDIAVWNLSLIKISATVSTLIANLAPVWVGLITWILFKKQAGKLFWIGTGLAIAGMVILVGYKHLLSLQFNIGIPLALLASLFYAIYIIITRGILQNISTITFMFYNMLAGSIFLLIVNLVMGVEMIHFPVSGWLCFLGMGLLCQLAGWLTINHSLRFLESTKVSIALLSQTVIAGFLAIWFLKETLEINEIIGSAVVLAGIAVTFLKKRNVAV
ncbi:DMT family transporter [Mucilaginibacter sp. L3T2-6]|uniref:DMT family transporter n=1 Tax=Mucilaginibacter sp. L3T2-6 TaxID=3062491 RepID=UPI002675C783|nr:DMT family transporter [Mucilaginibacter sp. L3T2-6]MDO3643790.1 DMT family transporter [Mucilaginibacter sp. L3T2-6]MDV6216241.1 DMT family transporter [Mucilaginibacter sp. L3T2-6]